MIDKKTKVKNSPHFSAWANVTYINSKNIYDLFQLLKKYSFIVSDGKTKVEFLRESKIHEENFSFSAKDIVYVNTKSLFEGHIDAVIGEIIFSIISNDSFQQANYATIIQEKIDKCTISVFEAETAKKMETISLSSFLDNYFIVDSSSINCFTRDWWSKPIKTGSFTIIHNKEQILALNSNNKDEVFTKLKEALTSSSALHTDLKKISQILSCLCFFHKYDSLSSHIVKYCESFIKEKILDDSFGPLFTNFAMFYLFSDSPENEFVSKFINDTQIVDMSKESLHSLTQKTILFFEDVLENHLQSIFDNVPAGNLTKVKNKKEFISSLAGISIINTSLLPKKYNLRSFLI
ncbi:hypothetical protein HOE37_06720 [Candidatus Woesearchaeota archaeon]|jgi:hypothetical protein|nr:hypothetical protein [Candidatus Woesearchaeota archaeon]